MKSFHVLEHTADIRLKVESDSLEKLFTAALEGMNSILYKDFRKKLNDLSMSRQVNLASFDITTLLIDFLSQVLTLSYLDKAVFHRVLLLKIEGTKLHSRLAGCKVEYFSEDIKAVTYHEANVRKNEKGLWETIIVFDV
jgi:SHS2 domain-containing protein